MDCNRSKRCWLSTGSAFLVTIVLLAPVQAQEAKFDPLRRQAEQLEKEGQWEKACDVYADLFGKDRNLSEAVKKRYQLCLRHAYQLRRHRDPTFRDQVLSQDIHVALKLYEEILTKLRDNYVDKDKTQAGRLFQQGLDEFAMALRDGTFRDDHLDPAKREQVKEFLAHLWDRWGGKAVRHPREARAQVVEVALSAQQYLGIKPVVVVAEFACGACNSLDEHSMFLTPGQFGDLYATLEGRFVGIGIDVALVDEKLVISQVIMGSPAALAGLQAGDRIVRIDKKPVEDLSAEAAGERLKGEAGSGVELEVMAAGDTEPRTKTLMRQAVIVPSVVRVEIISQEYGIGFIQLVAFQKTTVEELDRAIMELQMQGMKVLILDLRGNQGGVFPAAVQTAERFLTEGVIVSTQSQVRTYNRIYEANNIGALTLPLVVLIDGDTASAAEVVVGALKDHKRATLVGQATYGKGSIQCVLQLNNVPAGIRITLAKFFSPRGHAYNAGGVTPHIVVERTSLAIAFDEAQLQAAMQEGRQLAMRR